MDSIDAKLEVLEKFIDEQKSSDLDDYEYSQPLCGSWITSAGRDKNLNKILDQQAQIKMIIERDGRIKSLEKIINEHNRAIDALRKSIARIGLDSIKGRQELLEAQAKEVSILIQVANHLDALPEI